MPQEVELNLTDQKGLETEEQLFRVEVLISKGEDSERIRRRLSVPKIPDSLCRAFIQWQKAFINKVDPGVDFRRLPNVQEIMKEQELEVYEDEDLEIFDDDDDDDDTCSSCWDTYETLVKELNAWLNSGNSWQKIRSWLDQYLDKSESEIRIIIQTESPLLRQLPWQAWDIFANHYPQAEIALSPPDYEPPEGWNSSRKQTQFKILVVLGEDNNIDVSFDEKLFNNIKSHGAKIEYLKNPTLEELRTTLIEQPGWHIFFFAGHSETREDGKGILYLRHDENCLIYLTIEDIEKELKTAIENGLQLAIFNSCDGLGIANQLADLRLPQSIVMKEPVPNQLAVDFLAHFLDSFSRNEPLFTSVHKARNHLRETYNIPEKYPGGHWLPIIVPNPAVPLPKWKNFISEFRLPLTYRIPIFLAGILGTIGLPLSIILEFGFEKLLFYAKLYPHLVIFPVWAFWAASWSCYKGFCQVINKSKFKNLLFYMLGISILLVAVEITRPDMMLFELSESAQFSYKIPVKQQQIIEETPFLKNNFKNKINDQETIKISKSNIEDSLKEFIDLKSANKNTKEQADVFHKLMRVSFNYEDTWKDKKNWCSVSRWFYAFTFGMIVFTILIFFMFWIQSYDHKLFLNQVKYFQYIAFSQIMILLWIPFRLYYTLEIKNNLIFGYTDWIKNIDIFAVLAIITLLTTTLFKIIKTRQKYWIAIFTVFTALISLYIGLAQRNFLDKFIGLNTEDWRIWLLFPLFIGLLYLTIVNYQDK